MLTRETSRCSIITSRRRWCHNCVTATFTFKKQTPIQYRLSRILTRTRSFQVALFFNHFISVFVQKIKILRFFYCETHITHTCKEPLYYSVLTQLWGTWKGDERSRTLFTHLWLQQGLNRGVSWTWEHWGLSPNPCWSLGCRVCVVFHGPLLFLVPFLSIICSLLPSSDARKTMKCVLNDNIRKY